MSNCVGFALLAEFPQRVEESLPLDKTPRLCKPILKFSFVHGHSSVVCDMVTVDSSGELLLVQRPCQTHVELVSDEVCRLRLPPTPRD